MTIPERRYSAGSVELRGSEAGQSRIGGYALKYNRLSQNLGGFVERVAPGTFAKSLGDQLDVLARFQHSDTLLLGRVSAGTLRLEDDTEGLAYEVDLPDTSYAKDLAALAARTDVRHSSFAFQTMPEGDEWDLTDEGFPVRTLTAARLIDVAPVVRPAYLDTTSGLRSLAAHVQRTEDEVRAALADNRGAELLKRPPVVFDTAKDRQSAPHLSVAIARRRLALTAPSNN